MLRGTDVATMDYLAVNWDAWSLHGNILTHPLIYQHFTKIW